MTDSKKGLIKRLRVWLSRLIADVDPTHCAHCGKALTPTDLALCATCYATWIKKR